MHKYLIGLVILVLIGSGVFLFYKTPIVPKASNATQKSHITGSAVALIATSSTSSSMYHATSQLPGAPAFDISYPSEFGAPVVTEDIGAPSKIDFENNVESLDFYEPGSPHTYPQAGSQIFLHIALFTAELQPGQTLESFAAEQILPADTAKLEYKLTAGGRQVIAQTVNKSSPIMEYYILLDDKTVLVLLFGVPGPRGTQEEVNTLRLMEDKIVQSIKF